jgi:hypothetical protein
MGTTGCPAGEGVFEGEGLVSLLSPLRHDTRQVLSLKNHSHWLNAHRLQQLSLPGPILQMKRPV